jgi:hypothetical protein
MLFVVFAIFLFEIAFIIYANIPLVSYYPGKSYTLPNVVNINFGVKVVEPFPFPTFVKTFFSSAGTNDPSYVTLNFINESKLMTVDLPHPVFPKA